MELVTGAMGRLLFKLGELLKEEYDLHRGVKDQVKSLSRELESMHAALRKVGEVPPEQLDEQVGLWARDVRDASYDMEDVVDTFLVRVVDSRRHGDDEPADISLLRRLMDKMANLLDKGKARRQIADAIKAIRDQLQEVATRRVRYTVDSIVAKPAGPATVDPRLQALYKKATELVGINGPRDELIEMLSMGDGGHVDVHAKKMKIDVGVPDVEKMMIKMVSIVGFGGLGKTTLAKAVYDKVKPGFDCGVFVPVGRDPDMKKVFRDILIDLDKQFMNPSITMLDERQLINELREFVQKKRCFIVIDDIWDKKSWELIKCALEDGKCGSKVVTTTRISEVATHIGDVYKMQPLSRQDSKKLLYARTRIVDGEGKCLDSPPDEASDKILKKCGGVPLAIITIASLLANKLGADWYEVYNSIGFGHGDNEDVDNTRRILSFSYYDLPSHLKACLLYLSIFPEDHVIDKNLLIWKWIAEGFINEEQAADIGLFELGEGYFNELINRSMIQPVEKEHERYERYCRVHDMVLDLVRSLSREENFVFVLDKNEQHKLPAGSNARRLALQPRSIEEQNEHQLANMGLEQVRSFIASQCGITVVSPRFRVLRVLSLEDCSAGAGVRVAMPHLRSLLHLRYLGLRKSPISVLPKDVGDLKFLQTLDLSGAKIQELPETLGLLTRLLCLRADADIRVPAGLIGKLTSLQELRIYPAATYVKDCYDMEAAGVSSTRRFVKDLCQLRELRTLWTAISIADESMEGDLLASLGNLHKIQTLDIGAMSVLEKEKGVTWEAGFVFPQQLRHLCLGCFEFCRLPVWINSSLLPNLLYLKVDVQVVQDQCCVLSLLAIEGRGN